MEFSRQEYWSGLPFPSPGNLSDPGIKPESPTLPAYWRLNEILHVWQKSLINISCLYNYYQISSSHVWISELDYKESWVPKNWCFWTVALETTLESPLDCKSILKDISPEYSLEGLMLKLKLQYFGHLTRRTDSLEKTLMLGKKEGRRRRGQ